MKLSLSTFICSALAFGSVMAEPAKKLRGAIHDTTPFSEHESMGQRMLAPQEDSRIIAYLGNWHSCPPIEQFGPYTHIILSFAVSYTWSPGKNICSDTCEISTPPLCGNSANPGLISALHAAGKKVILSFGGAGMGGSWDGNNDCWEYCFGREEQVINRVTDIVNELNLDGVDIDYEYYYEDNQNGSAFSKGAQAQKFLKEVTLGLRNSLPAGSEITHAPMEPDIVPGKAYYDILVEVSDALDFLMPQYYNGFTRPAADGINGSPSALEHYNDLVDGIFGGDASKVVFGFCINDCGGTGSNANAAQAASVMLELSSYYPCNGGAFFWVADDDRNNAWSGPVANVIENSACNAGPTAPTTPRPTRAPVASPPTAQPAPTSAGTCGDGSVGNGLCAIPSHCCSEWGYCGSGSNYCDTNPTPPPVTSTPATAAPTPTKSPTKAPVTAPTTKNPTKAPVAPPTASPVASSGTCGNGSVGDGLCPNAAHCCSQWGHCGTGPAYCDTATTAAPVSLAPISKPPVTSKPTTKAPISAAPTSKPSTTATPTTKAPVSVAPTRAPTTAPPTSAGSGSSNNACCSQNFKDCDVPEDAWCNSVERCGKEGTCREYIWLADGAITDSTCIKRWDSGCYNDADCCDGLYCNVSSPWWKSCEFKES